MKKLRLIIYLFALSTLLAACSGEDGEPGPDGQSGVQGTRGDKGDTGDKGGKGEKGGAGKDTGEYFKEGSFEGTITGARRDGTAINETFKYEYRLGDLQTFDNGAFFERYSSATGSENFSLQFTKSGESITPVYFEFFYKNELNANTLLSLDINAEFKDHQGSAKEIDPDINAADYFFSSGGNPNNPNTAIYYSSTTFASQPAYMFVANPGNTLHTVYYSKTTGDFLGITLYNNSTPLAQSNPLYIYYAKLKFVKDVNLNLPVFFTVADNTNLSLSIPDTSADQFTITGYSQDATTGAITFDFTAKISGRRSLFNGTNSTNHDITITGKFNSGGKVYSSIVGRTRG